MSGIHDGVDLWMPVIRDDDKTNDYVIIEHKPR